MRLALLLILPLLGCSYTFHFESGADATLADTPRPETPCYPYGADVCCSPDAFRHLLDAGTEK